MRWGNISCRATYDAANIERIDRFLMKGAMNVINGAQHLKNDLDEDSLLCSYDAADICT